MAALPIEIITEILLRLPVKPLVRFKCVSKYWNSKIKSPNFTKLHLTQSLISKSSRHLLISDLNHTTFHSAELDLNPNQLSFSELHHPLKCLNPSNVILLGSCDGFLCFSNISKNDVFLYNPLTSWHRKPPSIHLPKLTNCLVLFGFGYDTGSDDYKVLRMVQQHMNNVDGEGITYNEAQVYSVKNNSWKSVEPIPHYLIYENYHGSVVNEALHYMVVTDDCKQCHVIGSFDLQSERFSLMDCPFSYNDDYYYYMSPRNILMRILFELDGCLCMVANYFTRLYVGDVGHRPVMICADLWVMKEYGNRESWVRLYSIRHPDSIGIHKDIKPVVCSKDGQRILLQIDYRRFVWYDLESKVIEEFTAHGLPDGHLQMSFFVGSLVSLEGMVHSERRTLPKKDKKK